MSTDHAAPLHQALYRLLDRVVEKAVGDAAPVPPEHAEAFRADVTRIAVDNMIAALEAAHPGTVGPTA